MGVAEIKISTFWDVDLLQVNADGRGKDIQLHSPDVVESPAEKAGRLNGDGMYQSHEGIKYLLLYFS